MSQGELFHKFIEKIKPSDRELAKAREHRDHVRNILNNQNIGIVSARNYGSYAKHTCIRPLNDLDFVIYINEEKYPDENVERILHRIARNIRPSFPHNNVVVGKRSVKVGYANGFEVDIVPALVKNSKYLEPARILDRETGKWIRTSPSKHIEFTKKITEDEPRYNNLVRIFKVWKKQRRRNFRSFFIELLIADVVINSTLPRGWAEAVLHIFKYVAKHKLNYPIIFDYYYKKPSLIPNDPVVVLDPVNERNNVASDITKKAKGEFLNAWIADTNLAQRAINAPQYLAVEKWKQIFGDVFPSRP